MATYYSQGTGNWSTLANWDTARDGSGTDPASVAAMDGQFFYIQPGHTVTFDVEDAPACDGSISGWSTTGIAQITIEGGPSSAGVLQFSATPNTPGRIYGLRIRNATNGIQGTANTVLGSIVGGSAESPIPTNAITTISGYGSLISTTYVSVMLYGVGPSEPVYRLTAPANAGDTILYVEGLRSQTNPQSETEWSAGRRVMTNTGITTLHGTTPVGNGYIQLASGFANALAVGELVALVDRNVNLVCRNTTERAISGSNASYLTSCILDSVSVHGVHSRTAPSGVTMSGKSIAYALSISAVQQVYGGIIQDYTTVASYGTGQTIWSLRSDSVIKDNVTVIGGNGSDYGVIGNLVSATVEGNVIIHGCKKADSYGLYYPNDATISGNVIIENCGVGIEYGELVTLEDNASITNCLTAAMRNSETMELTDQVSIDSIDSGTAIEDCTDVTISGSVQLNSFTKAFDGCTGVTLESGTSILNCNYGIADSTGVVLNSGSTIQGCSVAGIYGSNGVAYVCTLGGAGALANGIDIRSDLFTCYGTTLGSTNQASLLLKTYTDDDSFSIIKLFTLNGITTRYPYYFRPSGTLSPNSTYSPMPSGYVEICEMNFLDEDTGGYPGTIYNWYDVDLIASAGSVFTVDLWMLKDTNGMTLTPRAALFANEYPLVKVDGWSATPDDIYIMTDDTAEQTYTLTYDNSESIIDKELYLRVWGSNTSGSLYWGYKVPVTGGSTTYNGFPLSSMLNGMIQ